MVVQTVHPLHKLVVCGDLTLILLPDTIREWRFESELTSCSGSNVYWAKKTELLANIDCLARF